MHIVEGLGASVAPGALRSQFGSVALLLVSVRGAVGVGVARAVSLTISSSIPQEAVGGPVGSDLRRHAVVSRPKVVVGRANVDKGFLGKF